MKNLVVNKFMNTYKKQNKYDDEKLAEIKYGLEGMYLTFTKIIVIAIFAWILHIFKCFIVFTAVYIPIRGFSFGWHASTTLQCWIVSSIAFIALPYIGSMIYINYYIKVSLLIVSFIIFYIYAPADTKKRPIVAKKRRYIYKFLSLITIVIYSYFIVNNNNLVSNLMLIAIVYQNLLITPPIYYLSNQPFANYKKYSLN